MDDPILFDTGVGANIDKMDDQITLANGSGLLPAVNDCYGGVIVGVLNHMEADVFETKLRASMSKWRQEGKRGIWLKLPIELANLVETAVKEGFWYHHAEKTYLMLVQWIPQTIVPTIPSNASHRIGVGAIVVTEKRELLVVQEASGRWKGLGIWKIPTGVVEQGEDICKAAVREVKEETGVDTEFVEVLAFRESHKSFFEKSDMFFICFLKPLSFEIQKQDSEIDAVQWMPLEEFATKPATQKSSIFKWTVDLCLAKLERDYVGFFPRPVSSTFASPESLLYLNTRHMSQGDSSHQP